MDWILENSDLRVSVNPLGAELQSIFDKKRGTERLWQGDPAYWQGRAPLLFPWCGRPYGWVIRHGGRAVPAAIHGFAAKCLFAGQKTRAGLRFTLTESPETLAIYPYSFRLVVTYCLKGRQLVQGVCVENTAHETMPFNLGFHPGFALGRGKYELCFEQEESPRLVLTPGGYVSTEEGQLFEHQSRLPLTDDMFAQDSLCMKGLGSASITLHGLESGEQVKVGIQGYPYVLLWGPPAGPLPFVCIEPWQGLPDPVGYTGDFADKPGIQRLAGGQSHRAALEMTFS